MRARSGLALAGSLGVLALLSLVATGPSLAEDTPECGRDLPRETFDIVTFAGTTVSGFSGDGGPAVAAQLNVPAVVAFDARGNAFISDVFNARIRRVEPAGTITTVVGTGSAGFSGDDGPATEAQLRLARGLAFDVHGNLYIADFGNSCIRFVNLGATEATILGKSVQPGHITTILGTPGVGSSAGDDGPATEALLIGPGFLVFDRAGNLYLSDVSDQRIRFVNLGATDTIIAGKTVPPGHITTIAGTGDAGLFGDGGPATAARLQAPNGIDLDPAGNLYIADVDNSRVAFVNLGVAATVVAGRVVEPGHIVTIAGTPGVFAFSGDGGPATSAALSAPRTIAVDSSDGVWIADFLNNRIRFVNLAPMARTVSGQLVGPGAIATVAGNGVAGLAGDGGRATSAQVRRPNHVAFDRSGNPYIAEALIAPGMNGSRIRRLNLAAQVAVSPGTLPVESMGRWCTVSIQLPAGRDASLVDLDSVRLQAIDRETGAVRVRGGRVLQIEPDPDAPVTVRDRDDDGLPDQLVLKYDRATVATWSTGDTELHLRAEGRLLDGRSFSGDAEVSVRR